MDARQESFCVCAHAGERLRDTIFFEMSKGLHVGVDRWHTHPVVRGCSTHFILVSVEIRGGSADDQRSMIWCKLACASVNVVLRNSHSI